MCFFLTSQPKSATVKAKVNHINHISTPDFVQIFKMIFDGPPSPLKVWKGCRVLQKFDIFIF